MPQTRVSPGRSKKRRYTCPRLGLIRPAIVEEPRSWMRSPGWQAAEEQERASH